MQNMIENEISDTQDEINNSQPFSLSSSNNSEIVQVEENMSPKQARPPKFTGQRGNFRSKEEIDPKYRHVFTYPYFNEVQSRVIEDALYSDKSMVVCAPTGSGKTVIFEMAIVQLLMELEDKNYTDDFKIIYMAPVKALCTERLTEWYPKFTKLGHLCIEVTGDTDVEFPQLKPYRIIITTPEKWDMLTRRWKDHRGLVEVIKLFLIDEVHILNDEIRGPVLEAVVSRMKTIESSVQSTHRIEQLLAQYQDPSSSNASTTLNDNSRVSVKPVRIRFIAISATVSNPQDVALWLGTSKKPAVYYKFGDECRPVKLKRIVEGYPCPAGTSIFKFDIVLNYKLWNIIQKYHNGKPTLIFCNTRKSVTLTAETLSREITVNFNTEQKSRLMALASTIKTKKIQSLILCGVGCHHAGLLFEERINIETAFRNRDLPILITTTTLAMGVNLPAHLVIIKNTQQYVNGAYQEYSISTILQMVGRAGRPQYDTEATAVIMTRSQDKARYQSLVEGSEPLQSYLHKRLAENLNSEAALGTVCDIAQCVQWLNSTFLSVRAAREPRRYLGLPHAAPALLISKKIEAMTNTLLIFIYSTADESWPPEVFDRLRIVHSELCVKAMNGLATAGLISMDEACCIESTEAGRLMSIYYLDLETMKLIMKLEGSESLERLLRLLCESHELSDRHLRVDERRCLNSLNRSAATATIRFPMKGKISSRQMKLSCVIQAVLGCLPIPDPSLNQESMKIMRIADRVCKCLVYYVTRTNFISKTPKFYSAILNALLLAKCVHARLWENSAYVSKQLKGIGPIFSTLLASAGKVNFMLLEESHPRDLERIMNKGPPVGNIIRRQVSLLPKYCLTTTTVDEKTVQVKLSLTNHAHLSENIDDLTAGGNHKSYIVAGDTENYLLYLNSFKETDLINLYDGCITFQITRKHSTEHEILVHCISSTFVGIDEHCKYSFKDMNPFSKSNIQVDSNLLDKTPRNVNADDTFKERKRKTKDTTAIHCNEKKKRDLKIVEKFYNLKDLLGQTSKNIKLDINKTTEMSNKILENLELEQHTNNNITNKELEVIENLNESFENIFAEDFHDDEIVDDDKVSDILKEIENEIKVDKTTVLDTEQITNYKTLPSAIQKKYSLSTYNAKRKAITPKNNFNFIDKLDTKSNNDNINNTDICKETGFNNAIKGHIEKYLQEAHDSNSTKIDLTNLVEPEKYHKDVDVHKVYTKKTPEESRSIEKNQINNADMKQMQLEKKGSEVKNDDKIQISPPHSIQSGIVDLPTHTNIFNSIEADQNNLKIVSSHSFNKNEMIGLQTSAICSGSNNIIVVDNKFEGNIDDEHTFIGYPINLQNNNKKPHEEKHNFKNISNFENITSHDAEVYKQETNQIIPINDPEYGRSHTNNTNENLEYIRKYKASQTQLFNITSENSKQKVQIIGKLKIDLDVTEIVHNNESHTTIDTDNDKNNIKSISHIPCISTSHDKNTLGRVDVERRTLKIVEPDQQINENLKKTSDLTEYKKQNNNFPPNNDEPIKESPCIKDILQKYNNNARRSNKENEENTYTSKVQVNAQKEIKDATQITKISRRKLRIADIDKIHIDLPASLIGASQSSSNNYSNTESIEIEERSDLSQNNKHIETYNNIDINIFDKINFNNNSNNVINKDKENVVLNQNNEHLQIHTNNIKLMNESNIIDDISLINDAGLPSPDLTSELTDDNIEFDINAILNPKALLETMHTEDEVIPPPLQFSDNNTYSSVHLSQEQTNLAYFTEYGEVTEDFEINESVFPENTDIELTPTEFETRSPSHVVSPPYSSPGHSFTMMRKSLNENTNTLVYPNSRRAKLSHFKFKRKSMLRK